MNIVKIYKDEDEIPTFIIESIETINTTKWTSLWNCKEEIYIDETLIETKYHTL